MTKFMAGALLAATLATGCAGMRKPTSDDLAGYEAVARLAAYVGCGEIGDSLKASEREALRGSLAVIAAGLDSGRLAGLDAALESLGLRDQGHRLLVTAALQLAVRRIPEDVREHYAVGVTSAAVAGCLDGVKP